jgi:nucleoside-diphosphate-sugar epimerase
MSRSCLVTGCAGFIGSHLCERLVREGFQVVGIDSFTDYYPRPVKESNLAWLRTQPAFRLIEANLLAVDLPALVRDKAWIFHQAAQAGVRASWGDDFRIYSDNNILATQRLLEAAKDSPALEKLVYASSSSVYGDAESYPTHELMRPQPVSPYGVSKLAAEHLCGLYHRNFGLPAVSLRYFTVYGPRQRPDMAFHRFISAWLEGRPIVIYGDGEQTRDFTFVSDTVTANLLAAERGQPGAVYNIGGGSRVTVNAVLAILEAIVGKKVLITYQAQQKGDVQHTGAETSRATRDLGFETEVRIQDGLRLEFEWIAGLRT